MNKITSINGTFMASLKELKEHTENETAHITEKDRTAWNAQATVKAGGILIATQEDLDEHTGNKSIHVAEEERATWNAKADASALTTKADASSFNAHKDDTIAHITTKERETWNGKQDKLTDEENNMTLAGGLTAAGTVNANSGVRVPLPSTAQEALSYQALIEHRATGDWRRMRYYMDAMIPSWVTTLVRQMQMSPSYNVGTANASTKEGASDNDLHDFIVTFTGASGLSLLGRSTGAWKFSQYMGDHINADYAAASVWRIIGSDKISLMIGSTSQGYSSATNPAAPCYSHPIHWADYHLDGADYRYPLLNAVNGRTGRDMTPAWQMTIYPKGYLGSSTSCLVRGTDYGRDAGDQQYVWALAPQPVYNDIYVYVAMAPRQPADHKNVTNRWSLFIGGKYVMPMTSLFCGTGHTAALTVKAKSHEVSSTYKVGLRMGGMRIDAAPELGATNVLPIMERVVMDGATAKPVPAVEPSSLEAPAEGGNITLTVSSTLAEAMYVINDTMCGHDPAAVWCTQSTEQIPSSGGQVTLTLAANTTGAAREVWAFVGHHYGQAAVVKIIQSA